MANTGTDIAVLVEGLSKDYPGRRAVDSLYFKVAKGTIHGFLGPNGAGKSTTLRMIAGLMVPTEGQVVINGVIQHPENIELKNQIGLLPENAPLYPEFSVKEYLKFVLKLHGKYQVNDLDRLIHDLQLSEVSHRLIGHLSRGYRQRVGLAQAMVYDPEIIIMDEPTTGLDPHAVIEWRELIKSLTPRKTIIFSSHILSEVELLCDDITVIHHGKIRASGKLTDIQKRFNHGQKIKIELGVHKHLQESLQSLSFVSDITSFEYDHKKTKIELVLQGDHDMRPELISWLVSQTIPVYSVEKADYHLEEIFMKLTGESSI